MQSLEPWWSLNLKVGAVLRTASERKRSADMLAIAQRAEERVLIGAMNRKGAPKR